MSNKFFNTLVISGISLVVLIIVGSIGASIYDSLKVSTVKGVKVEKLEQQQIIKGSKSDMRTEIRYLIITDKETFISESSILNSKFDNSNVFFTLKEGGVYDFKVSGHGKSLLFDYRNILSYTKIK